MVKVPPLAVFSLLLRQFAEREIAPTVSEGPIVLIRALLRGMGHEAECDILVRKLVRDQADAVSAAGSARFSECSVISAPANLPDGEYRVLFEGHLAKVRRKQGVWSSCEPVSRVR